MTVVPTDASTGVHATRTSSGGTVSRAPARPTGNPLKELTAHGKMPVVLEMHLTENDRLAFHALRQRCLADNVPLSQLTLLGQYLRQLDTTAATLTPQERSLAIKLTSYADLVGDGRIDLIALDDGARGRDTLDNAIVAELLSGLGVDASRIVANIVARNRHEEQLRRRLAYFASLGVRNALLLTGDLPAEPGKKAVFPMDSVGLCALARRMIIEGELPGDFVIAAAGHPSPDADPDGIRTLHKALAGARLIITQAIYSTEEFARWMQSLRSLGVLDMVEVLAEVVPISSARQLRVVAQVPGMRVPPELIEEMEAVEQRLASAAVAGAHDETWLRDRVRHEGMRRTRALLHAIRRVPGVNGFYLGCVKGFDAHLELLKETPLVTEDRTETPRGLKLSGPRHQRAIAEQSRIEDHLDQLVDQFRRRSRSAVARAFRRAGDSRGVVRALRIIESPKIPIFGCKQCDACDLSPDALVCPRGCAKQMTHGPCGAPQRVGDRVLCEDRSRECTWAHILRRRDELGVPWSQRLEVRRQPAAEFYEGRTFSAFLPVLTGRRQGPNWSLGPRAAAVAISKLLGRAKRYAAADHPQDMLTLVKSQREELLRLLAEKPEMDREELLAKALFLVGTPVALHIIESILAQFGLPAEGTMFDLSIREQFQLAEAIPPMRRAASLGSASSRELSATGQCDALLTAVPEGRELRRAMRRELAAGLIRHIGALGVRISYSEILLDGRFIEGFLAVLAALKDEIQLAAARRLLGDLDMTVRFDRVSYKHHYRPPIAIRWTHDPQERRLPRVELAVDVRQHPSVEVFRLALREAMDRASRGVDESEDAVALEPFRDESRSVCWSFNRAYWQRLRDVEQATGVKYDASIGGSTDHNLAYVRSTARAFFDRLRDRGLTEGNWYVVEIGVASPLRARTFLDEFRRVCDLNHVALHEHVTYVLADFSETILERSLRELSSTHARVTGVRMDLASPTAALSPFRGRVMHAHLCNVFDNLPADRYAAYAGDLCRVQVRAHLPRQSLAAFQRRHGLDDAEAVGLLHQLSELAESGPEGVNALLDWFRERVVARGRPLFDYVNLWMDLFHQIRFTERYVVHTSLDQATHPTPSAGAETIDLVRSHLSGAQDVHAHVSEAALAGFRQLLDILHPHGVLEIVDLFTQRIKDYSRRFMGPAKYDGSTVNWLDGPLFQAVAEQAGHRVRFNAFKPFDPKSVSVILVAEGRGDMGESKDRD